ncbi:hypothetical protein BN1080_00952 [Planococcus massiliensis]|uniref:Uncharacterized protein n=1 Tax=Planococcus massiliensis TaxID=1499687 RepID=A0A098EJN8_9BACL|nr:hypothetical protein BN1080_00952 [Planococcus massiliensis]
MVFVIVWSFLFPLSLSNNTSYLTGVLIIMLSSIITALGYFKYFKYNLILFSDQKQYISLVSNSITRIVTTIIQIILILNETNVVFVVLMTPLFSIIRLMWMKNHVIKYYRFLDENAPPNYIAIKQKWNSLTINVSNMLKTIVPIIFITIMFGFEYASIFTIYSMVFHIGRSIVDISCNGISATMGNIVIEGDAKKNERIYLYSSNMIFIITSIFFVCFWFLTLPFIDVYIGEASDISYYAPLLVISLIVNESLSNLNFTPNLLIRATGKYKETSRSAVLEVFAAIILTPFACYFFGFQGALFGSIVASLIRTIYITWYCRKKILSISFNELFKNLFVYIIAITISILTLNQIEFKILSYVDWILYALLIGVSTLIITLIMSLIFFKKNILYTFAVFNIRGTSKNIR